MKRMLIPLILAVFLTGCITKHTPVADFEAALDTKDSARLAEYLNGYGVLFSGVLDAVKSGDNSKWQFKMITENSYNYKIIEMTTTSFIDHLLIVCKKNNDQWSVIGAVTQQTQNSITPNTTMFETSDGALIFYIIKSLKKTPDEEEQAITFYKATSYVRKVLGAQWDGGEYIRTWTTRVEFDPSVTNAPIKIIYNIQYYQPINPDRFKPNELAYTKERTAYFDWSQALGSYLFDSSKSEFSRLEMYFRFKTTVAGLYKRYPQDIDGLIASGSDNQKKWAIDQKNGGSW